MFHFVTDNFLKNYRFSEIEGEKILKYSVG